MNPHYETVLTALRQVETEIKAVHSNDGERLDAWQERKLRLAAERLADLLFPIAQPAHVKFGFGKFHGLYAVIGSRLYYFPEFAGKGGWRPVCGKFEKLTKGEVGLTLVEKIFPDAVKQLREIDKSG